MKAEDHPMYRWAIESPSGEHWWPVANLPAMAEGSSDRVSWACIEREAYTTLPVGERPQ